MTAESSTSFSTTESGTIENVGEQNKEATIEAKGANFGVGITNKEYGKITASGDNTFEKAVANEKDATFENSGNADFSAGLTNKGALNAKENSSISGKITNSGTSDSEKGTITAEGATFNGEVENQANGIIEIKSGNNTFSESVTNAKDGTIDVKAGNVKIEKSLENKGTLTIESGSSFSGNGVIANKDGATITTKGASFENKVSNEASGTITATGDNAFNGGLENAGIFTADNSSGNTTQTISGEITNTGTGTITAKGGDSDDKKLSFSDKTTIQSGTITVTGNVDFSNGLDNAGTLNAGEANTATTIGGDITNSGTITAKGGDSDDKKLTFKDKVINTATDSGKGITATGKVDFGGGLDNSGVFNAGDGKTETTIGGTITNKSGGKITANGNDSKKVTFSESLSNESGGEVTATGSVDFTGTLENSGNFTAGDGNTTTTIGGAITNQNGGTLEANKATFSDKITNESGGTITAKSDNTFTGGIDNSGTLNAESGSTIGGAITNSGELNAKGATFGGSVTNNEGGTITATGANTFSESLTNNGTATIESDKTTLSKGATNAGTLTNRGEVEISANQKLTNTGTITAENGSKFSGDGEITNSGTINANGATFGGSVTTEAGSKIIANGDNTFSKADSALNNVADAEIIIESGKTIFSGDLTNAGTFTNNGNVELAQGKTLTNSGTLEAKAGSQFSGQGTITNSANANLNATDATFAGKVTNEANGTITANGDNTFTGGIDNSGTLNVNGALLGTGAIANKENGIINANGATFEGSVTTEADKKSTINIIGEKATTFNKAFDNVASAEFNNNGEVIFKEAFKNKNGTFNNNGAVTFESTAGFYSDKNGQTATDYTNNNTMTFKDEVNVANFTNTNQAVVNAEGATFKNANSTFTNSGTLNASGATFEGALTNYGNAFVFGSGTTTFSKAVTNSGYFEARSAIAASEAFNNTGNLNLIGSNAVLTLTSAFTNDGKVIFSFLNGGVGQIDASDNSASFKNTENKGKIEVDLKGMGKNLGEKVIIKDKDGATDSDSQITLKDSDIIFIGGSGTYLGNGKIIISEVFPVIPDGTINTPIIATQRANVASMNNMFLASNAILSGNFYNAKYGVRMANRSSNKGFKVALNGLKSNESYFYDSSDLLADARSSAKSEAREVQGYELSSAQGGVKKDNFYFLLTPFVNHTSFKEMGGVKVSGLDYGFVTAFGGKVADDNTLGVHFVFDYAKLKGGSEDITNTNLMIGLNYRLDLIYEMYLKARGDFYYFMNKAQGAKPNSLGGGVNVAFGKDFVDWKEAGVLGIELGIDYKALNTGKVTTETIFGGSNPNDEYKGATHHLLFVDLGLNYYKYFATNIGLWGFDAGIGGRANLTQKLANTLLVGNRSVDITLDNDRFLGYVSVGGSYVLEAQSYDMEFTLRYNGSFGDKSISNGGSFEWRTKW